MSVDFTPEEKNLLKCNIFKQNVNPNELDESSLPTDIHLVEYEVDGKLYVDSVRAYKAVDIFDPYYDKVTALGGKLISISSGYGKIKPNLFTG